MDCHVGQMDAWVEPLNKVLRPNLQNLCYTIDQFCRFFGTGCKCKAALSFLPKNTCSHLFSHILENLQMLLRDNFQKNTQLCKVINLTTSPHIISNF